VTRLQKVPRHGSQKATNTSTTPSFGVRRLVVQPHPGAISALTYYTLVVRPWLLRWRATAEEVSTPLPGDELVPAAAYTTTRAVTVRASAESIWPWLVQLGQARAGFYTYDRLEQIVGAAVRSADRIVPEFQQLAVGDTVLLSPVGGNAPAPPVSWCFTITTSPLPAGVCIAKQSGCQPRASCLDECLEVVVSNCVTGCGRMGPSVLRHHLIRWLRHRRRLQRP